MSEGGAHARQRSVRVFSALSVHRIALSNFIQRCMRATHACQRSRAAPSVRSVVRTHGMRNEVYFRLKELHWLVQCPHFLLARIRNISAL
jgi:hypothetical protein